MQIMREKDPRFVGLEKKIGLFVLTAIAFIALAIVFFGVQQDIFRKKDSLYFSADSGAHLNVGQAVKFKGFKIGKVDEVALNPEGKVIVELRVIRDYMKFIKADSVMVLTQEDLIGESIIEVQGGSPDSPQVAPDSQVIFKRAVSINDIAEQVKAQADKAIDEIKKITTYVSDPEGDIRKTIANVQVLTAELIHTRRSLQGLLDATKTEVIATVKGVSDLTDQVRSGVINDVSVTIKKANNTMDTAQGSIEKVNTVLDKVSGRLDDVKEITDNVRENSPKIPGLLQDMEVLIMDLQDISGSLKQTWPISRNVGKTDDRHIAPDVYETVK